MSIYDTSFALLTNATAAAQKILGGDKQGVKLSIRGCYAELSAGSGTQFTVRYYTGWTGALTHQCVAKVTIPATAGDWDIAAGGQAFLVANPPVRFSTLYKDFPEGWTDTNTPRAGLGLYVTATQAAGGSATNALVIKTDVGVG